MIYKIGEVAKMLNVSKATIYKWEKKRLVRPFKSQTRQRRFDENHIMEMKKILGIRL